jgi:hypothetical protein
VWFTGALGVRPALVAVMLVALVASTNGSALR